MSTCGDETANAVNLALSHEGIPNISATLASTRPVDAEALSALTLHLSQGRTSVPWEHIEASIQAWRVKTDLEPGLHCPHCKEPDTSDHYRHFYRDPPVAVARRTHLDLLVVAIYTCKLKLTTARALTTMCTLDNDGRHVDPGARGACARKELVDYVIFQTPDVAPVLKALIALIQMGSSHRTQG